MSNSNYTIDGVKIKIGLLSLSNRHYCFDKYEMSDYLYDVNSYGLEDTWAHILNYVKQCGENEFLNSQNFAKLYEIGLAELDKNKKKKSGQYYTPYDVSKLMASWLLESDGSNICDVGCGTVNLIMAYLDLLSKGNVENLLKNKKIYLYDFDKVALTIAQFTIAMRYGIQYLQNINTIYGDFLNTNIVLPN